MLVQVESKNQEDISVNTSLERRTCTVGIVSGSIRKYEKHLFFTYLMIMMCYLHYIIQVQLLTSWKGLNGRRLVRIRSNKTNKTTTCLLMYWWVSGEEENEINKEGHGGGAIFHHFYADREVDGLEGNHQGHGGWRWAKLGYGTPAFRTECKHLLCGGNGEIYHSLILRNPWCLILVTMAGTLSILCSGGVSGTNKWGVLLSLKERCH